MDKIRCTKGEKIPPAGLFGSDVQKGNKIHGTIFFTPMYCMIQYITSFGLHRSVPWKEPHDVPKRWAYS